MTDSDVKEPVQDDVNPAADGSDKPAEGGDVQPVQPPLFDLEGGSAAFGRVSLPAWSGTILPDLEILGVRPGLVLSDRQRQHVDLLRQMLASEGLPSPKARQRRDAMAGFWAFLMRFGTAFILLAVVVLNVTRGTPGLPKPEIPAETRAAFARIERLEVGDTVLVAFDYQPGFAFELEEAARPVLAQITARGARLVTLSTLPLGPLLAEEYFNAPAQGSLSTNPLPVAHLGYLPGGPLGMARVNTAIDETPVENEAQQPSLDAGAFPDFPQITALKMILVITDDAQKGRDWIEQVHPRRQRAPLIIVTSAQAAPVLRPYLSTGGEDAGVHQIAGLVAGYAGGLSVDGRTQAPAAAEPAWNAYEMGVTAGALIILAALAAGQVNRWRLKIGGPSAKRRTPA